MVIPAASVTTACAAASPGSERNGGNERPPDITAGAVGINEAVPPVKSETEHHDLPLATPGNFSGNFGLVGEVPMDTAEQVQTRVDVEKVEGGGGEGSSFVDNSGEQTQDGVARGELHPIRLNERYL